MMRNEKNEAIAAALRPGGEIGEIRDRLKAAGLIGPEHCGHELEVTRQIIRQHNKRCERTGNVNDELILVRRPTGGTRKMSNKNKNRPVAPAERIRTCPKCGRPAYFTMRVTDLDGGTDIYRCDGYDGCGYACRQAAMPIDEEEEAM